MLGAIQNKFRHYRAGLREFKAAIHRLDGQLRDSPLSLASQYPETSKELVSLFRGALNRIPVEKTSEMERYWFLLFDLLLRGAPSRGLSILSLLDHLTTIQKPCSPLNIEPVTGKNEKSLNILFTTALFPGVEHGGGLRIFDMITELADRGHRVSLYSEEDLSGSGKSLELLKPYLHSYRTVKSSTFGSKDYTSWLRREQTVFDAIHYVWPHASPLIQSGKEFTHSSIFELIESCTRRCILDLERHLSEKTLTKLEPSLFHLLTYWCQEHVGISSADRVVALTETDARFSEQLFGVTGIDVVATGVSKVCILDRINASADPAPRFGEHSAVFVGNYQHYPNKDGVLWFLNEVHQKVRLALPDFQLIIAGIGAFPELAAFPDNERSIRFVGPFDDLVEMLQSAKICISPLISGAGLRGKVNQYCSVKRPTVTTSIGNCGMPFRHDDSIVVADSPDEFAAAIISLLTDDVLYKRIQRRAGEVATEFASWAPHIQKLEEIYSQ